MLHAFCDEGEEAVRDTGQALVLSPLDPHRYFYGSLADSANLTNRDYPRALELARQSIRANRMHTSIWRVLAIAQWQLGMQDEARQSVRQFLFWSLDSQFAGISSGRQPRRSRSAG